MNFNRKVYLDIADEYFLSGECNLWGVIGYMSRHNIHEKKHRIEIFKKYFESGRDAYVNGSASGRIVVKHYPELVHLLKIGFIKQTREFLYPHKRYTSTKVKRKNGKYFHGQTVLSLNK